MIPNDDQFDTGENCKEALAHDAGGDGVSRAGSLRAMRFD